MESITRGILTCGCTGQVIGGSLLDGSDQTWGNYGGNGRNLSEMIFSIKNGTNNNKNRKRMKYNKNQ